MFKYIITKNTDELLYASGLYKTKEEAEINAYAHRDAIENILDIKVRIKIEECE